MIHTEKWARSVDLPTLVELLEAASDAYYNSDHLLLTDEKFDAFLKILSQRSPSHPFLGKIGYRPSKDAVKLPYHMGSLDKDIKRIMGKSRLVISHKVDGVSAMISEGRMYTRGNGEYGQDITHLIPPHLPQHPYLAIRGELYLPHGTRQDTVGIVNRNMAGDTKLDFVAYEIISVPMYKPSEQFRLLQDLGFKSPFVMQMADGVTEVELQGILEKERKRGLPYPMDGLVLSEDVVYPRVEEGNPIHSVAFKVSSHEEVETEVEAVEWRASRAGKMIPRIRIKPVKFGVEMVRYTTGFNARYIVKKGIGPGAIVRVGLKGDVIPIVTDVVRGVEKVDLPPHTEWDGVHLVTTDEKATLVRRLTHFVKTLGIKGISDKSMEKLVQDHGIQSLDDLLQMTDIGAKLKKGVTKAELIVATGAIPGVGMKKAKGMNELPAEVAAFVKRHGLKLLG